MALLCICFPYAPRVGGVIVNIRRCAAENIPFTQSQNIRLRMLPPFWARSKLSDGPKVLQIFRRSKPSLAASSEAVKDFKEIPSPSGWPLLGNLLDFAKNVNSLDKYACELQAQYGDIVRLRFPKGGSNNRMVMLFRPQHMKSLYTAEERIPKLPGLME